MPNARQTSVIGSPSRSCATNRRRSSTTEHSFHGIHTSRLKKAKSVTHVSGTNCHLCLRPHSSKTKCARHRVRHRLAGRTQNNTATISEKGQRRAVSGLLLG